jgi:protein TonB
MTLVSGHPLLVPAATQVVREYVYQTTLLNGNPVEIHTVVDVPFTLPPGQ